MKSIEELLVRIINHLAEKLKDKLILKGGMLLRLYQSPRSTQDVDFVLISEESKKKLKNDLVKILKELEEIKISEIELNSKGIFIDVESKGIKGLIEINILSSVYLPTEPLSTAALSEKYFLSGRIVSTMAIPEAFSHKIAATLEREAMRDLFDLSQMEGMSHFDLEVLKIRLSKLSIQRGKFKSISLQDAARALKKRLDSIDQKKIETELYPLIPTSYRAGILGILRASVGRIVQRLEALEDGAL